MKKPLLVFTAYVFVLLGFQNNSKCNELVLSERDYLWIDQKLIKKRLDNQTYKTFRVSKEAKTKQAMLLDIFKTVQHYEAMKNETTPFVGTFRISEHLKNTEYIAWDSSSKRVHLTLNAEKNLADGERIQIKYTEGGLYKTTLGSRLRMYQQFKEAKKPLLTKEKFTAHLKNGGEYDIVLAKRRKCGTCGGFGKRNLQLGTKCDECGGTGKFLHKEVFKVTWK